MRAAHVSIPLEQRFRNGFADGFKTRKMNHGFNGGACSAGSGKYLLQQGAIPNVAAYALQRSPGKPSYTLEGHRRTVGEVVEHEKIGTNVQQNQTRVTANEAGTAGNQEIGHKYKHLSNQLIMLQILLNGSSKQTHKSNDAKGKGRLSRACYLQTRTNTLHAKGGHERAHASTVYIRRSELNHYCTGYMGLPRQKRESSKRAWIRACCNESKTGQMTDLI